MASSSKATQNQDKHKTDPPTISLLSLPEHAIMELAVKNLKPAFSGPVKFSTTWTVVAPVVNEEPQIEDHPIIDAMDTNRPQPEVPCIPGVNFTKRQRKALQKWQAESSVVYLNSNISGGMYQKTKENYNPDTNDHRTISKDELSVAVIRADNLNMSKIQGNAVKNYLEKKVFADCESIAEKKVTAPKCLPHFDNWPVIDFVLRLWCDDEATLDWLSNALAIIPADVCPRLMVRRQRDLIKMTRANLVIPNCKNSWEATCHILNFQNKWAHVNTWTVYAYDKTEDGALYLSVGVPEKYVPLLWSRGRRLAHSLGSVYLHFIHATPLKNSNVLREPPSWSYRPKRNR